MVRKILLLALVAAVCALAPDPVGAQYSQGPVISGLSQANTFTIQGEGATPGGEVRVFLEAAPGPRILLGSATADAAGRYEVTCTLPPGVGPGRYTVVVLDADGSELGRQTLVVPDPGDEIAEGAAAPDVGALARTGSSVGRFLVIGAVLIGVGGIAIGLGRRRRAPL